MANYDGKTLQFFSNHPNQPFEFVSVTDINYYKAIFSRSHAVRGSAYIRFVTL
jgi:hypothetical protein